MIPKPFYYKMYSSAKKRFLHNSIVEFFKIELPLLGPAVREKVTEELIERIFAVLPPKEHVQPGQIVWNAVSKETRSDHPNCKFIPVILTLIDSSDIQELVGGTWMSAISRKAVARICNEAFEQGALLSMRDIGLFSWRHLSSVSKIRKDYESENNCVLPHSGSLQDMGSCISHKSLIIRKVILEKKDPATVARETKHSQRAVDHYLKGYQRVKTCHEYCPDIDFICQATSFSKRLVREYLEIMNDLSKNT